MKYRSSRFQQFRPANSIAIVFAVSLTATAEETPALSQKPAEKPGNTNVLPEMVVSAAANPPEKTAYKAEEASVSTRIPEPILDTPRSVQVITPQLLEDTAANDPQEAVKYSSGVIRGASYNGVGETFLLRGFQQEDIFKDGFRAGTAGNTGLTATGPTDMANIDRIEILKGPAAILFGRGEPGGVVNYLTKEASFENEYSLEQSVGSYDFYRTELNANWNAVPDKFAFRLDAAYDKSDSFTDYMEGERFFIAPAFTWQIAPDTTLSFRGEYTSDHQSTSPGLPYLDGRVIPGIPHDRYMGEPGFTQFEHDTWRGIIELEHRWNEWTKTTVTGHARTSEQTGNYFLLYNFAGPLQDPTTGDIARAVSINDHVDDNYSARIDQIFDWTIFDGGNSSAKGGMGGAMPTIKNQLLVSGEFERQEGDHQRFLGSQGALNPYNPQYTGYDPLPLVPVAGFPLRLEELSDTTADAWSLLLMDRISFGESVYLSLGGRVEWFESDRQLKYPTPGTPFSPSSGGQTETEFNPFAGLVVKPTRDLAVYASYSESTNTFLNAFASPTVSGEALDPETARQFEVGVKQEFFDKRVIASAAVFQIDKEDVAGTDPANPLFSINAGEERSRGFETDITGEILPGLRVTANYTYTDAEITSTPLGVNEGNRRWGVPYNSGAVFTTYELQDGPLKGFGFGGGVFAASNVQVDNAGSGTLPGYAQTDLVFYYQQEHWRAQLNVKNVLDKEFYYATSNNTMVAPAAERMIVASLKYEF